MTLPARAAAVRGDDYQYAAGWYWACRALTDPDVVSVSVEDAGGGSFDDVVVCHRTRPSSYKQVKSSNTAETVVTERWLTTAVTPAGQSPLQHFYATWARLRDQHPQRPELALVTNRGLDPADPILALRDNLTETVADRLRSRSARSAPGTARRRWAEHLGVSETKLLDFLADLRFQTEGSEASWDRQARDVMRAAGLRDDDDAVARGKQLVREWVKTGAGPQSVAGVRQQVTEAGLLARSGTLVLAVHGVDRRPSPLRPTVELHWVDRYVGLTSHARRDLVDGRDRAVFEDELHAAVRTLESFGVPRVHVTGSMRLPTWFTIGHALPDVRGWVVSCDQRGAEWRSDTAPVPVEPRILAQQTLGQGDDLAVGIALTQDLSTDVSEYLRGSGASVAELLVLGPAGEPGRASVPDAGYAVGWAHAARKVIRAQTARLRPPRVHLFLAGPAGAALMLGHHWNLMPVTVCYEHQGYDYAPGWIVQ